MQKVKRLPKEHITKFVEKRNRWTCYYVGWVEPSRIRFRKYDDTFLPMMELIHFPNRQVLKPNKEYNLIIDYPAEIPYTTKIKTNEKGMLLDDLLKEICKHYRKMYKEEVKTSTLKEETYHDRFGEGELLFNRAPTNGKYGIWGHFIEDLVIDAILIKGKEIRLSVSS